jgi:hypothetical protein
MKVFPDFVRHGASSSVERNSLGYTRCRQHDDHAGRWPTGRPDAFTTSGWRLRTSIRDVKDSRMSEIQLAATRSSSLVEVRSSPHHGLGVFAATAIPRGTTWWSADIAGVVMVSQRQMAALTSSAPSSKSHEFIDAILEYGYYLRDFDAIVFIPDDGRYVNHSTEPNSTILPGSNGLASITTRDVLPGEEITEDYTSYDHCPWARMYGEFGRHLGCW